MYFFWVMTSFWSISGNMVVDKGSHTNIIIKILCVKVPEG